MKAKQSIPFYSDEFTLCQCEDSRHYTNSHFGCSNEGTHQISPSYKVCNECKANDCMKLIATLAKVK